MKFENYIVFMFSVVEVLELLHFVTLLGMPYSTTVFLLYCYVFEITIVYVYWTPSKRDATSQGASYNKLKLELKLKRFSKEIYILNIEHLIIKLKMLVDTQKTRFSMLLKFHLSHLSVIHLLPVSEMPSCLSPPTVLPAVPALTVLAASGASSMERRVDSLRGRGSGPVPWGPGALGGGPEAQAW